MRARSANTYSFSKIPQAGFLFDAACLNYSLNGCLSFVMNGKNAVAQTIGKMILTCTLPSFCHFYPLLQRLNWPADWDPDGLKREPLRLIDFSVDEAGTNWTIDVSPTRLLDYGEESVPLFMVLSQRSEDGTLTSCYFSLKKGVTKYIAEPSCVFIHIRSWLDHKHAHLQVFKSKTVPSNSTNNVLTETDLHKRECCMLHQSNIVVPVNVDYELSGPIHAIVGDARKDSVLSMFDAAGLDLDISVSRILMNLISMDPRFVPSLRRHCLSNVNFLPIALKIMCRAK